MKGMKGNTSRGGDSKARGRIYGNLEDGCLRVLHECGCGESGHSKCRVNNMKGALLEVQAFVKQGKEQSDCKGLGGIG
jgi:hypothetical protein